MIQIENAFFDLAEESDRNCLVICDRGAMDASAFVSRDQWEHILAMNGMDEVEIRDNRYNQVYHFFATQLQYLLNTNNGAVKNLLKMPMHAILPW